MHIGKPTLVDRGGQVALSATITSRGRSHPVWFAVADSWARYLDADCLDPFVVGALPLALRRGEPVYSSGRLSARLLFALNTAVPALVTQTGGDFRPIQVRTAQAVDYAPPPPYSRAVATGFSGGIDSFCVLADHFGPAVLPAHRLTHLFVDHCAAPSLPGGRDLAAHLQDCAHELHLPVVAVDSNLEEILGRSGLEQDHQFRTVAKILVLQKFVGTYLYAAGHQYRDCFTRGAQTTLSQWDPVLLPHLSTERLRILSVGGQYSRAEKTERVAAFPPSRAHLHVCSRPAATPNCSVCPRCALTLLTLELLGHLQDFAGAFDLDAFAKVRSHYIVEMLRSPDPQWTEIRQLARARGHRFPRTLRLVAALPPRIVDPFRRPPVDLATGSLATHG